ncbi:hypothetical protein D3C87_2186730 [compost metagenome]
MDIQVGEMRSCAVERKRFTHVGMRQTESSEVIRGRRKRDMGLAQQLRIFLLLGQAQQLLP